MGILSNFSGIPPVNGGRGYQSNSSSAVELLAPSANTKGCWLVAASLWASSKSAIMLSSVPPAAIGDGVAILGVPSSSTEQAANLNFPILVGPGMGIYALNSSGNQYAAGVAWSLLT